MIDLGVLSVPAIAFVGLFGYSVLSGPETVVEPIPVAPAIEHQGYSSKVVSSRLLDEIALAVKKRGPEIKDVEVKRHPLERDIDAVGSRFDVSWIMDVTRYSLGLVPYYFAGDMVVEGTEVELRLRGFFADGNRTIIVKRGPIDRINTVIEEAGRDAAAWMDPETRPELARLQKEGGTELARLPGSSDPDAERLTIDCLAKAADRLPRIAGLKIANQQIERAADGTLKGAFFVSFLNRTAYYDFSCKADTAHAAVAAVTLRGDAEEVQSVAEATH